MKKGEFYFMRQGVKVAGDDLRALATQAQKEANRLGRAVMVYAKNKAPTRKVYASNPGPSLAKSHAISFEGQRAAKAGKGRKSPYKSDTPSDKTWLKGFDKIAAAWADDEEWDD